jgi:hypothetical protein
MGGEGGGLVMLRLGESKKLDIEFLKELTVNTKHYDIKNFLPEYLTRANLLLLKACVSQIHSHTLQTRLQSIFPPPRDDSSLQTTSTQPTTPPSKKTRNKSTIPQNTQKLILTTCPESPPKAPSEFEILI